jgi:hypothetical protein
MAGEERRDGEKRDGTMERWNEDLTVVNSSSVRCQCVSRSWASARCAYALSAAESPIMSSKSGFVHPEVAFGL